jgi:uncharacterized protein (DUF4415 family)
MAATYSNLAKVDATTDEEIARQMAKDPDTVIDAFRVGGRGWQSRINAVLRRHLWGEEE